MPLREPLSQFIEGEWERGVCCAPLAQIRDSHHQTHCYLHHLCFACCCPAIYALRQRKKLVQILDEPYPQQVGFACCCTTLYAMENRHWVQTRFNKRNSCCEDWPLFGCLITAGLGAACVASVPFMWAPMAAAAAAGGAAAAVSVVAGGAASGVIIACAGYCAACCALAAGSCLTCGAWCGCDCSLCCCCCEACNSSEGAFEVCCCCCAFCNEAPLQCGVWEVLTCWCCMDCLQTCCLLTSHDARDLQRRRRQSGCCACWETTCDFFYACSQLPFCSCMMVQQQIEIDLREWGQREYLGIQHSLLEFLPSWQRVFAQAAIQIRRSKAAPASWVDPCQAQIAAPLQHQMDSQVIVGRPVMGQVLKPAAAAPVKPLVVAKYAVAPLDS